MDEVHAPMAGAAPEEIAVVAEIIKVKNQHYSVDEKVETAVLEGRHGVMVTIAEKSGSSPRGVGSKMLVNHPDTLQAALVAAK